MATGLFSPSITLIGLLFDMAGAVLVLAPDWDIINRTSLYMGQQLRGTRLGSHAPFKLFVWRSSLYESIEALENNEAVTRDDPFFEDFHQFVTDNVERLDQFDLAHNPEYHEGEGDNATVYFAHVEDGSLPNTGAGDANFGVMRAGMKREITNTSMMIGGTLLLIGFSMQAIPQAIIVISQIMASG